MTAAIKCKLFPPLQFSFSHFSLRIISGLSEPQNLLPPLQFANIQLPFLFFIFQLAMASSSSTAAASSSSSTVAHSSNNYWYEVFLNHRGPDVKETFARDLYRCLLSHGLRVFLDQPELQVGETITSQIEDAIRTASVHVAIFSPRYAESNWCLDELVLMLESGATIIPVFYNVKPLELRWNRRTGGLYAQSLHDLATKRARDGKLRYDPEIIEKWRDALSRVAEISGFELQGSNGGQEKLLDKVVKGVLKKVPKTPFNVAKYPTGVDEKLKDFENTVLLQLQHSGKPMVVGIVGLGGVGKTTLAKALFNQKSSDYSRSCLLSDVREVAGKGSLISLQSNLIESLTGKKVKIQNKDQGIETLKEHLKSSEILLVIDDVDHVDQVDALLPVRNVNSLVFITSRNKDVLTSSGVEESAIYKLTGLNAQHSRELFCSHAFHQPHPLPGFESLLDKFLQACDGLPLSLKVFGALLCGKMDTSYWEDQLDKLQRRLPNEIKERLKVSFEALDEEEQQIFLDIACFFIGRNRDWAIKIWEGSDWAGRLGFRNLQNRCLVEVQNGNEIHMHDHLRDLGREIAEISSPHRLWRPRENIDEQSSALSFNLLDCIGSILYFFNIFLHCNGSNDCFLKNGQVIAVRGIRIVRSPYNDNHDAYGGIIARRLQLLDTGGAYPGESILKRAQSPNLIWLHWKDYPYCSLPSWIPMKNMRVLNVSSDVLNTLWESNSQAPLLLRELEIRAPLCNIPKSIGQLKHLERVVLSPSNTQEGINLKELPEEFCDLLSLKTLVLQWCGLMMSLPDSFGNLTKLEHLQLFYCKNLKRLPNSFGNLISLKYLNLAGCSDLTISSETLGNISTLEYINLSLCGEIDVLPQLPHQKSLVTLDLSHTGLKGLPSAIGELRNLEVLRVGKPLKGEELLLKAINTPLIRALLQGTAGSPLLRATAGIPLLKALPPSVGDLRNLKELSLLGCSQLKCSLTFVGLLTQLTALQVRDCPLISELSLPPALELLDLWDSHNFRKIDGLSGLAKLRTLRIPCNELEVEELCLETLVSLEVLNISGCVKQKSTSGCVKQKSTMALGLDPLASVGLLTQLTELGVWDSSLIHELSLPHTLRILILSGCHNLRKINGLCGHAKLQNLCIHNCSELEVEEPFIETLVSLEVLEISGCAKLEKSKGLDGLTPCEDGPRLQWDEIAAHMRQFRQKFHNDG